MLNLTPIYTMLFPIGFCLEHPKRTRLCEYNTLHDNLFRLDLDLYRVFNNNVSSFVITVVVFKYYYYVAVRW